MILDEISEMISDRKRRRLLRRHAINPQGENAKKDAPLSLNVLESILTTGNVNDIRLVCDMEDIDIVNKVIWARKDYSLGGFYVYDAYELSSELDAIRIIQNRMKMALSSKCPASKRQKFDKTSHHKIIKRLVA